MRARGTMRILAAGAAIALAGGWWAAADDRDKTTTDVDVRVDGRDVNVKTDAEVAISEELPASVARVSDIDGMNVYGSDGKELGEIKDIVIDLEHGTIRYAVLSFGGFLGVGDKLFAVPWQAMQFDRHDDGTRLVLAVDKDRLEKAPGFNSEHWPNFADAKWTSDINKYYGIDERRTGFRPEHKEGDRKHHKGDRSDTGIRGIDETRGSDGADVRIEAGKDGADVDIDTRDNR